MKQRHYKRLLNIRRRRGTRYPWIAVGDYTFFSHPVRDWLAEFGNPTNLMGKRNVRNLIQGEIGSVDGGFRFIIGKELT